jgi:hypothetical protein
MVHYEDTIRNKVEFERIAPHVASSIARKLRDALQFGAHVILTRTGRSSIE